MEMGLILALAGAAAAVALAGIGSSIGVGIAGSASNGLLSEQPEKFGPLLILTALPGTQGLYGFVVVLITLNTIGMFGTLKALTPSQGLNILLACLPVAIGGLVSGIHQGKACAAGVAVAAKQPRAFFRAVILAALVETYAVLGLIATIVLLNKISEHLLG